MLLPEIVGLDDERHADLGWEELLQRLQQRLDEFPLRAAHVDDDGEAAFTHVLAGGGVRGQVQNSENRTCKRMSNNNNTQSLYFLFFKVRYTHTRNFY